MFLEQANEYTDPNDPREQRGDFKSAFSIAAIIAVVINSVPEFRADPIFYLV